MKNLENIQKKSFWMIRILLVLPFFSSYLRFPLVLYAAPEVSVNIVPCDGACEGNNYFSLSGLQVNGTPMSGAAAPFDFNVDLRIRNQDPYNLTVNRTTPNGTALTINLPGTDGDNEPLAYSIVSEPRHGTFSISLQDITYTPTLGKSDFKDSMILMATDGGLGSGYVVINFTVGNPVGPFPSAVDAVYSWRYPVSEAFNLGFTGDLNFISNTLPGRGSVTPNAAMTYISGPTRRDSDAIAFTSRLGDHYVSAIVQINVLQPELDLIELRDGSASGSLLGSKVSPPYGVQSFALDTLGMSDGEKDIYVSVKDKANSIATASVKIIIDNTPPTCTYVSDTPVENTWVGGDVSFVVRAIDNVIGSGVQGVNLVDPRNSSIKSYLRITGTSDWSFQNYNSLLLIDGVRRFDSECYDRANNVSPRISWNLRVDNTPPTTNMTLTPAKVGNSIGGLVSVNVTGSDGTGSGVVQRRLKLDGNQIATTFPFNLNTSGYAEGSHVLMAEVVDAVGNVGSSLMTLSFVNSAPLISITSPTNGARVTGSLSQIQASVSPINGSSVGSKKLFIDGVEVSFTEAAGIFSFSPAVTINGPHTILFQAQDVLGNQRSISHTFVLSGAANSAPIANGLSGTAPLNSLKTLTLVASDTDGDALTYSIVSLPSHGTLGLVTGNTVDYTPTSGFSGSDSLTYKANDGLADSNVASISLLVNPNGEITASDSSLTTSENVAVSFALGAVDVNGHPLVFTILNAPTHGSLTGTAPNMTYTPALNYHGLDSLMFKASDGVVDSNNASVIFSVGSVNQSPLLQFLNPISGGMIRGANLEVRAYISDDNGPISNVTLKVNNGNPQPMNAEGSGVWTYGMDTTALPQGSTILQLSAQDSNGLTTQQSINVTIDNLPPVVISFSPAVGSNISGLVPVAANIGDNFSIDQILLKVDGEPVAINRPSGVSTSGSISYSWDSTLVANGTHVIVVEILDKAGNSRIVSNNVTVLNGPGLPPVVTILTPQSNDAISSITVLRMTVTGTVLTAGFRVDGGALLPATPVPGTNEYKLNLNTLLFSEGSHIIGFIAANAFGSTTREATVVFDNTLPTVTVDAPTSNQTIFLVKNFIVRASDSSGLPLASVRLNINASPLAFFPGHTNVSNSLYSYSLDTTGEGYPDGNYALLVVVQDKAGNETQVTVPFRIDNLNVPLSNATVAWTPTLPFVVGAANSAVKADISNALIDADSVSPAALKVFLTKDGETTQLPSGVKLEGNSLKLEETIPSNARVHCVLAVLDKDGKVIRQTHDFISGMDRTLGGTVSLKPEKLLALSIPPDALKENALVELTKSPLSEFPLDGKEVIYGPILSSARNSQGIATTLTAPARLRFERPVASIPEPQKNGFVDQAEIFTPAKSWKTLGGSGLSKLGKEDNPVLVRAITVPVEQFGVFRITALAVPSNGISNLLNMPNPFSPAEGGTDFSYLLGSDSEVNLVLYDLLGNLVRRIEIASGNTGGKFGPNLVHWDGKNGAGEGVANGGYILQITAKDPSGKITRARYKVGVAK